jgi:hypothetical protein
MGWFVHGEAQKQKALVVARAGKNAGSCFEIEVNNHLVVNLIR